ncbi:ABC transporter ATP-binding protein [Streptomyces sp. PAL114]|uniref:ABC transporter ATP-binding protein n=1 Tax=Streptomyces sp. PAL114 TaxID=2970893 RepID=UPI0028FD5D0A|nr:ABC transporter ATP-binding protein [Streptomyces sp. PAL114]MDU0300772.1 ABC transporter ATP-binding protein [Streptomyces sp. PAL114]
MPGTDVGQAVTLRAVSRLYGRGSGRVTALSDVHCSFRRGTCTAVMGPSGSGKSTLLQCAAGLDRPSAGQVLIGDTDISTLDERELTKLRRERVGFVFQSFNLMPSLDARKNVALPMRLAGRRPSRSEVDEALRQVGLQDRGGHRPAEMSGGQQQRVAIARALISRPEVLFADEPTGALDTNASRDVLTLLRALVDTGGQTVVMVTHDPVAASWADRVLFLVDGAVHGELTRPTAEAVSERMARLGGEPC